MPNLKRPLRKMVLTLVVPDASIFKNFNYKAPYLHKLFWNYCYLNRGLSIYFNGEKFISENQLKDLLEDNMESEPLYPIIHLEGEDIEVAFTHVKYRRKLLFICKRSTHNPRRYTFISVQRSHCKSD